MQYVASAVRALRGKRPVGDGNCVLLVQQYANVPETRRWRQGPRVIEQATIWPGTPIATFENGVYPNWKTGNHAALFLRIWQEKSRWNVGVILGRRAMERASIYLGA